ncbi:MAG: putative sugar O-methyltransferase [Rhodospirillum sp.]|nr:putative sugar O-methyltransferase [Rhodospirillum sp.]MCF8488098.1 putative sugar O-methyltransferase [Rhodospirillum sp.]MCF8501576.1 putative sugar O-methyltransferase [Rhodospirillum sp.]
MLTSARILSLIEEKRSSQQYRNYLTVRDAVLKMREVPLERIPETALPSAYWTEELSRFLYMFDASPLVIDQLRHHTYHITGIQVYGYRTGASSAPLFAEKLEALKRLDETGLFVPEAENLGGFGHLIDGQLVNIDTLKYYESMVAMGRGGALEAFGGEMRRTVMEIGSGWGGLAHVFKRLFPNTTYICVDLAELFLFSATYLMSVFPEAKVAFLDADGNGVEGAWSDYDFIFVPNTLAHEIKGESLDLCMNTVSFQEMTTAQVTEYVALADRLGAPLLYSLNRKRSVYSTELTDVHEIIGERYDTTEIPMLPVPYTKMMDSLRKKEKVKEKKEKGDKKEKVKFEVDKGGLSLEKSAISAAKAEKESMNYKHVVGRRKIVS